MSNRPPPPRGKPGPPGPTPNSSTTVGGSEEQLTSPLPPPPTPPPVPPPLPSSNTNSNPFEEEVDVTVAPPPAGPPPATIRKPTIKPFETDETANGNTYSADVKKEEKPAAALPNANITMSRPPAPNRAAGARPPAPNRKAGGAPSSSTGGGTGNPMQSDRMDDIEFSMMGKDSGRSSGGGSSSGVGAGGGNNRRASYNITQDALYPDNSSDTFGASNPSVDMDSSGSDNKKDGPVVGYNKKDYLFEFDHEYDHNTFNKEAEAAPFLQEKKYRNNLPNSKEFTNTNRQKLEVPKEFISRLLLSDEEVVGEFDAYVVNRVFSNKQIILYSLLSFGLFALYYFVFVPLLYYFLCCFCDSNTARITRDQTNGVDVESQTSNASKKKPPRWNYNLKHRLDRSKIIITSLGRVITWTQTAIQHRGVDRRVYLDCEVETAMFHVRDLRQINLSYSEESTLSMCNCQCCRQYLSGLEIVFHGFKHEGTTYFESSKFLQTSSSGNFISTIRSLLNDFTTTDPSKGRFVYLSYLADFFCGVEKIDEKQSPQSFIIMSDRQNAVYDTEFGLETLEDLIILNKKLTDIVAVWQPAQVFLDASSSENAEIQKLNAQSAGNSRLTGIKEVYADISDFQPVDDDGNVTVPAKYMPLASSERLVAAFGQHTKDMTWRAKLATLVTFGLYYFCHVVQKRKSRSAIILTTKRVTELIVEESRGNIPSNLVSVTITLKHYYPGHIKSGYMMGNGSRITSGLDTLGGQLMVNVPSYQLSFIQKLHMTTSRYNSVKGLNVNEQIPPCLLNDKRRLINEAIVKSQPLDKKAASTSNMLSINGKSYSVLTPDDHTYLPIFNGETAIHRVEGGLSYSPCCAYGDGPNHGTGDLSFFCHFKGYLKHFKVCVSKTFTCCLLPLITTPSLVITDHSLLYISTMKLDNCCSDLLKDSSRQKSIGSTPFIVAWSPIREVTNPKLKVTNRSAHPVAACCSFDGNKNSTSSGSQSTGCVLGEVHIRAEYELDVRSKEGFSYHISNSKVSFANWVRDEDLTYAQGVISAVLACHAREEKAAAPEQGKVAKNISI